MSEIIVQNEAITLDNDLLLQTAEAADKRITAINRIKSLALRVTSAHDWVDQGNKPYLQASGSQKVARLFGISWQINEPKVEVYEDGHFMYSYTGTFTMQNVSIEALGTRSSRDPFFKRYAKTTENQRVELPPTEIDRGDVQKAAFTNLLGNGITSLLGLKNMTWEEVSKGGVSQGATASVDYSSSKTQETSEGMKDMRKKVGEGILLLTNGIEPDAKAMLAELTSFVTQDGKTVNGKTSIDLVSEKQLNFVWGKIKEQVEAVQKEQEAIKAEVKEPKKS